MANIINGDNGVVSGTAGLKSSSDGTGILALQTNGTTAVTVDASQNVGIGTTSPSYRVDIQGTTATQRISSTTGTNAAYQLFSNTGQNFYVGLDNSAGNQLLSAAYGATLLGSGAYPMVFGTNNTERMRIDSSGNLLINRTSSLNSNWKVQIECASGVSTALVLNATTTSNTEAAYFRNPNGIVGNISISGSSTSYNTSSDYRLKEAIAPMTGALAKVALLKPCTYKWKVDGSDGQGFIAHELAEVEAGCVTGEKDAVDAEGNPQYQGIDTSFLIATLTAAIQEQQDLITTLTARITALEVK